MKWAFISITKFFLVVIVCSKMLLCFSIESFSKNSAFSWIDQSTECEMDGEEKSDVEPEDEYFLHAVPFHDYRILKINQQLTSHSSHLTESLVFEIVPPPPKA